MTDVMTWTAHSEPADQQLIVCDLMPAPKEPGRILVVPWGHVRSTSGDFLVNEHSAKAVLQAFQEGGVDLPIDREHASLGSMPGFEHFRTADGGAPAMGWIKALDIVPNEGIYATVDWTPQGARSVSSKEYRYLSPVVAVRKADSVMIGLHSVALTNKPAIRGMRPIVNKDPARPGERTSMDALKKLLGLAEDASEQDVTAAITKLQASAQQASALREGLVGLAGELGDEQLSDLVSNADPGAICTALKVAMQPTGKGAEQQSEIETLRTELVALKQQNEEREWESFVLAHKDSVELVPAKRGEWKKLWLSGHKDFVRAKISEAPTLATRNTPERVTAHVDVRGRDNNGIEWKACAEATWKAHAEIRREFDDDEKAYRAYVKAHKQGLVKVLSPALQQHDPYAPAVLQAHALQTQYGLGSRAIIGTFYERLEGEFDKSWVSKIGMTMSSNQESETYRWLGMVPQLREWIGGRQAKGLREDGFTIVNKLFEATLKIGVDDLRRDKTGQIRARIAELAARASGHWEKLVSDLINAGGTSLCYDGQYFFDTDHSSGASGAQKNLLTSSEVPALNVATATAPTALEFAQALLGVISYMFGYVDDQGEPANGNARNFLVMCAPSLSGAAMAAVTQSVVIGGAGAADNPLKASPFVVDVAVNPRLTSVTDAFYLFRTDAYTKPFILQEEQGVQIDAVAEGSEYEFLNRAHLYGLTAIRNAGYGMWQQAIKATMS